MTDEAAEARAVRTLGEIATGSLLALRPQRPVPARSADVADASVRAIAPEMTDDCPPRGSAALKERCDLLFASAARL